MKHLWIAALGGAMFYHSFVELVGSWTGNHPNSDTGWYVQGLVAGVLVFCLAAQQKEWEHG